MPTRKIQKTTKKERGELRNKEGPLEEVPPEDKENIQIVKQLRRRREPSKKANAEALIETATFVTKRTRRNKDIADQQQHDITPEVETIENEPKHARTKEGSKRGSHTKEGPLEEVPPEDKENIQIVKQPRRRREPSKKANAEAPNETATVVTRRTRRNKDITDEQQNDITPEVESIENKPKHARTKEGSKRGSHTDWAALDLNCCRKNSLGRTFNLKISSWNTDNLGTWLKKGCLEYVQYDWPDIFCVQETNCSTMKFSNEMGKLKMYRQFWCSSVNEKVAGVAIFTVIPPITVHYGIGDEAMDKEGRCIVAEFEFFYLVCVSTPDAGKKLIKLSKRLEWLKKFKQFVKTLDDKKPVIICGNMNVAHNNIDLAKPDSNLKNAGFTQKERDDLTDFLADGYIDTWRQLYPDRAMYTYWPSTYSREKNFGWRLDYFIVSKEIIKNVCEVVIRSEVFGSKHCPMTLFLNF